MEESPLDLGLICHQQEKERTTPRCTRRDRVSLYRRESQYSFSCPRSFLLAPSEGFEPSTRGLEHRCRSLWLRGEKGWRNVLDSNQRSDGRPDAFLAGRCFRPLSQRSWGGGFGEIRTHGGFPHVGFQDRCNKPLCHKPGGGVVVLEAMHVHPKVIG